MSNVTDAINACHGLLHAMHVGDCTQVEQVLNDKVRSPDKHAKGYVKGYWMASRHFACNANPEHVPILRYTHIGGWKCFDINADN